jgi:ABC-2 type transport system permease protein
MRFAFLVAWREYAENAKTKGFWLGILLVPVIIFFSVQVPIWLEMKGTPTRYFVLVDQAGGFGSFIEARLDRSYQKQVLSELNDYARKNAAAPAAGESNPSLDKFISEGGQAHYLEQLQPRLNPGAPSFKPPRRPFARVELPTGLEEQADVPALAQELKPYLRGEKQVQADGQSVSLNAAILIPRDIDQLIVRPGGKWVDSKGVEYWSGNLADNKLRDEVEQTINSEVRRREYLLRGLDGAAVREVEQTYAPFSSLNPKKEAGKEAVNTTDIIRQWAPSAFVYLLWVAVFAIVQMLLNNIIEEKSNRIIEVLLSSVTPGELMTGKLLGIAAVGLTMVGSWMLALFSILSWKAGGASAVTGQMLTVLHSSSLIPMFAVYFLLGYVMYAACILAIGSVCNTLKEAQSYMGVITMVMMVPLMTMTFIPKDPNGFLARVLSWIPLYTPFIMMNRAMADPPLIDLIGTLVLLIAAAGGALWMAGKVFRIGILRTGQPPKLFEMLRWLKRSS